MEITMTTGARYFPQFGLFAAPGEVGSERVLMAPWRARLLCVGRFHRALIHPIGTDLPVIDRMRRSASEP